MTVTVLLFGPQAQLAGASEIAVEVGEAPTADDVLAAIGAACEALRPSLGVSRLAVNHAFASGDTPVSASDEVALIGMVSGG
ncbi:MAG: MoaD/ThiS family protein [Planctomycetota bacterium]